MLDKEIVRIKVEGEFACFTRPDLKVERMTYPCMTPSAARGILEAILWRPEFQWFVRRILVLNPIKFTSIKRNEILKRQGRRTGSIDIVSNRVQRNSIVLKDVAYIIEASVYIKDELIEETKDNKPITVKKYREMFERRVKKGQCWHQPCLGTREFVADFSIPNTNDQPHPDIKTVIYPIGSMFYDMLYDENGVVTPLFFYDAKIENGVLKCPEECAKKILSSSHIQPKLSDKFNRAVYEHYIIEEVGL